MLPATEYSQINQFMARTAKRLQEVHSNTSNIYVVFGGVYRIAYVTKFIAMPNVINAALYVPNIRTCYLTQQMHHTPVANPELAKSQ